MSEELPIDTLGGIIQRIQTARTEGKPARQRQCPATFTTHTKRGDFNTVFCEHREGHEGEHKGYRKRWPNTSSDTSSPAAEGSNG